MSMPRQPPGSNLALERSNGRPRYARRPRQCLCKQNGRLAYFSMEIALEAGLPTYSGGLGVLAGDTIRSAADLKVPMVAVTLLHRKGYFYQRLDASGWQTEEPAEWVVQDFLEEHAAPGHGETGGAAGPNPRLEIRGQRHQRRSRSLSIYWTVTCPRTRSGTGS